MEISIHKENLLIFIGISFFALLFEALINKLLDDHHNIHHTRVSETTEERQLIALQNEAKSLTFDRWIIKWCFQLSILNICYFFLFFYATIFSVTLFNSQKLTALLIN